MMPVICDLVNSQITEECLETLKPTLDEIEELVNYFVQP